jgi:hypothetical protein
MEQLAMTFTAPRARRRDPQTSHKAADRAKVFAPTHAQRIVAVLRHGDFTAAEIADESGLTVVQVCRRLPEISEAKPTDEERQGYRVWSISAPEKTKPAASTAGL